MNKRVFTREISSRDESTSVYGETSLTVYTFLPRWNFIPGWGMKDRDEISSRDEKKKKRRVNTSSRDGILKWACFFNFWRMYSIMFSKFNMFEHNESTNIVKHKASVKNEARKEKGWEQQVKNQRCKNIFIISFAFFGKFTKDWNFILL